MFAVTVYGLFRFSDAAARQDGSNSASTVTSRPPEWHCTAPAEKGGTEEENVLWFHPSRSIIQKPIHSRLRANAKRTTSTQSATPGMKHSMLLAIVFVVPIFGHSYGLGLGAWLGVKIHFPVPLALHAQRVFGWRVAVVCGFPKLYSWTSYFRRVANIRLSKRANGIGLLMGEPVQYENIEDCQSNIPLKISYN